MSDSDYTAHWEVIIPEQPPPTLPEIKAILTKIIDVLKNACALAEELNTDHYSTSSLTEFLAYDCDRAIKLDTTCTSIFGRDQGPDIITFDYIGILARSNSNSLSSFINDIHTLAYRIKNNLYSIDRRIRAHNLPLLDKIIQHLEYANYLYAELIRILPTKGQSN